MFPHVPWQIEQFANGCRVLALPNRLVDPVHINVGDPPSVLCSRHMQAREKNRWTGSSAAAGLRIDELQSLCSSTEVLGA